MPTAVPNSPVTPGWLDWYPNPSKPTFALPPGTVDTHCHIFGPQAVFPFAPERKYTPCDASKDQLFALRDHLGIARNVIVQATCHGADNTAMVDALQASGDRARGIATVRPDIGERELRALDAAGVRGVRFNFVRRLVDSSPEDDLSLIAKKIAPLGWHIVLYFESSDLPDLEDFFASLPTPLVIDHMGRPDVTRPADGPEFSPDGSAIYFNSEVASTRQGHAQLFRHELATGSGVQLTFDDRVNWFPHPSPDGRTVAYLSYPPGTVGHPANLDVMLCLLELSTMQTTDLAAVFGGQGTINVPSWAPDSRRLAYVAYPIEDAQ